MSGWSALTLHFKSGEDAEEYLSDVEECLDTHDKVHYSDPDIIKVLFAGYGRHREAVALIEELRHALNDHPVVIDANDTTDSGDAYIYQVYEFGSRNRTDVYPYKILEGETPERGQDVAEETQNQLSLDFLPYSGR